MSKPFKILVVDDAEIVRAAVNHALAGAGHEIRMVDNGTDALRLATEYHPDLMLLDVNLPDINGLEVCRRIKQDPKLKSILVMHLSAARVSSEDQVEGLESGADGYLSWPVANAELRARVQSMLRIKAAEEDRDRLIGELQEALASVKTLTGLLPICAACKKIRDDQGYWNQLEAYLAKHAEVTFTHGICPDCVKNFDPQPQWGQPPGQDPM